MTLHRAGTKCECELPEHYDERTRIALAPNGKIIVAHPDYPPMFVDNGKLVEIILTESEYATVIKPVSSWN